MRTSPGWLDRLRHTWNDYLKPLSKSICMLVMYAVYIYIYTYEMNVEYLLYSTYHLNIMYMYIRMYMYMYIRMYTYTYHMIFAHCTMHYIYDIRMYIIM